MARNTHKSGQILALTVAIVALTLIVCPAVRAQSADISATPAIEQVPASDILVKLWSHAGTFTNTRLATLDGNVLYVAGTPRGMDAINISDGSYRFRHVGKYAVEFPPLHRLNVLYLVEGGQFVTVDRITGDELSRNKTRLGTVSPLFPGSDTWGICSTDDRVYGIVPETGRMQWRLTLDDHIVDTVWDGAETVYIRTDTGTLYAISLYSKAILWKTAMPRPECSPMTLANESIYIGCVDYYLYKISTASGEVESQIALSAPVLSRPIVTNSRVYAANNRGVLHAVNAEKNQILWTFPAKRMLTSTDEHVILLAVKDGVNAVVVVDKDNGAMIAQASAARYEHFEAGPKAGVFYAVTKSGDVLAVADRKTAEALKAAKKDAETKVKAEVEKKAKKGN